MADDSKEDKRKYCAEKDRQNIIDVDNAINELKKDGYLPELLVAFVKIQEALIHLGYNIEGFERIDGYSKRYTLIIGGR